MLKLLLVIPTIFPVLFAAFAAKSLQSVALYLAEKGTTLGRLEELLGSQTLGGTFVSIYSLRSLSGFTTPLLAMWSLSPLGGQSALRMLGVESQIQPSTVLYRHPYHTSIMWGYTAGTEISFDVERLYSGALAGTQRFRSSPRDVYGNVRIPMLEALTQKADSDGWIQIANDSTAVYSSILGIPMVGVPDEDHLKFNIESRYIRFDCFDTAVSLNDSFIDLMSGTSTKNESAIPSKRQSFTMVELASERFFLWKDGLGKSNIPPATVRYVSKNQRSFEGADKDLSSLYNKDFSQTFCRLSTTYVESRIECDSGNCAVRSVRSSRQPHLPENLTDLDVAAATTMNLFTFFGNTGTRSASQQPYKFATATEMYICDVVQQSYFVNAMSVHAVVGEIGLKDLSERLTQLFNGYYDATRTPGGFTPVDSSAFNTTPPPDAGTPITPLYHDFVPMKPNNTNIPFLAQRADATIETPDAIYRLKPLWVILYIISVVVLVAVSVAGAILREMTRAPDILTSVSSLTRDNPYACIESENEASSVLPGAERSRLLAKLPVIIADITPEAEHGHVAFATKDEGYGEEGAKVNRRGELKLDRQYI